MTFKRKQKIIIVSMLMLLAQRVNGYYPQYYRHPYRRRPSAARQYRRRPGVSFPHRDQTFVKRTRSREEAVRDLGDRIELYVPCMRGKCNNYEVQLKDHQRHYGTKKIVVTGRQGNPYRDYYGQFGLRNAGGGQPVTFYENEWLVPDNVILSAITRETTKDGFLKITFPRRMADVDTTKSKDYTEDLEAKRSNEIDPLERRSTDRGFSLHTDGNTGLGSQMGQEASNSKMSSPAKSPSESWKPSPALLEEEQKWTYPADPGIEVEDIDDCCFDETDSGVKVKSPSIGYWSREKFVYY